MANNLIQMKDTKRTVMLFMLMMIGIMLLVLFSSGTIGYATSAGNIDVGASLFQALVAIVTIFSVFIIFSLAVSPPMYIDPEIMDDPVSHRTEISYLKKFVKKAKKKGFSDEQIKDGLMRHNWGADLIDSCLKAEQEA